MNNLKQPLLRMAIQESNEMANSLEHALEELSSKLELSKARDGEEGTKSTTAEEEEEEEEEDLGDNLNADLESGAQTLKSDTKDTARDALQSESIASPDDNDKDDDDEEESVDGNVQESQPDALRAKEKEIRDLENEIAELRQSLEVRF